MAGPSTEYLAEQLDKIRDEVQAARREALDGSRRVGDIFATQLQDIRENMVEELTKVRGEMASAREALKEDQSLIRQELAVGREASRADQSLVRQELAATREALKEDQSLIRQELAALKAQTTALVERFDRTQDFLKQLLFWLLGSIATVGGAVFWKAAEAVNRLDDQGHRIEAVEKEAREDRIKSRESSDRSNESQAKLRESIDQLRNALSERPSPPPAPPR